MKTGEFDLCLCRGPWAGYLYLCWWRPQAGSEAAKAARGLWGGTVSSGERAIALAFIVSFRIFVQK